MEPKKTISSETVGGLAYPSFSVVFIHTFTMPAGGDFGILGDTVLDDYHSQMQSMIRKLKEEPQEGVLPVSSIAERVGKPIVYMEPDVENLLFSARSLKDKHIARYSMRGFDFRIPVRAATEADGKGGYKADFPSVDFEGHANVEVSQFFGNIFSVTYRFLFDDHTCRILEADESDNERGGAPGRQHVDAETNHLISLLSAYLGAEYWSEDDFDSAPQGSIDLTNRLIIKNFWLNDEGIEIEPEDEFMYLEEGDRVFDKVALLYKKYLMRKYSAGPVAKMSLDSVSVAEDSRYAMVDIWESVKHPYKVRGRKRDLFADNHRPKLGEAGIINHIRDCHKAELVGLMTMYPAEWPFRADEAFDEVCGENIAIDVDDLVLVGSHMCVVIGTYGRRGDGVNGVNWKKMMMERRFYHVSWEEYLLVLQFVLAKKHTLSTAMDRLISLSDMTDIDMAKEVIGECAKSALETSMKVIELDVIKHAKFPSHKIMYDRTARRLNVEDDFNRFKDVLDIMSGNLQSLGDYQSVKSDAFMNKLLIAISVVSLFELTYQDNRWPFMKYIFNSDMQGLASWTSFIAGGLAMVALGVVIYKTEFVKKLIKTIKEKWNGRF